MCVCTYMRVGVGVHACMCLPLGCLLFTMCSSSSSDEPQQSDCTMLKFIKIFFGANPSQLKCFTREKEKEEEKNILLNLASPPSRTRTHARTHTSGCGMWPMSVACGPSVACGLCLWPMSGMWPMSVACGPCLTRPYGLLFLALCRLLIMCTVFVLRNCCSSDHCCVLHQILALKLFFD